jgi:hypothetical protein
MSATLNTEVPGLNGNVSSVPMNDKHRSRSSSAVIPVDQHIPRRDRTTPPRSLLSLASDLARRVLREDSASFDQGWTAEISSHAEAPERRQEQQWQF